MTFFFFFNVIAPNHITFQPDNKPRMYKNTYHCGLWQMASRQSQFHSCRSGCTVVNSPGPRLPPLTTNIHFNPTQTLLITLLLCTLIVALLDHIHLFIYLTY